VFRSLQALNNTHAGQASRHACRPQFSRRRRSFSEASFAFSCRSACSCAATCAFELPLFVFVRQYGGSTLASALHLHSRNQLIPDRTHGNVGCEMDAHAILLPCPTQIRARCTSCKIRVYCAVHGHTTSTSVMWL